MRACVCVCVWCVCVCVCVCVRFKLSLAIVGAVEEKMLATNTAEVNKLFELLRLDAKIFKDTETEFFENIVAKAKSVDLAEADVKKLRNDSWAALQVCVCVYIYMYIYIYIYVNIYIYMYIYIYIIIYVCMCGWVCIHIYVCIYIYISELRGLGFNLDGKGFTPRQMNNLFCCIVGSTNRSK